MKKAKLLCFIPTSPTSTPHYPAAPTALLIRKLLKRGAIQKNCFFLKKNFRNDQKMEREASIEGAYYTG